MRASDAPRGVEVELGCGAWIYDTRGQDTLVLSINGGPGRENPRVVNLNIDAFESVDIIGDGGTRTSC
jgi:hypothetical protein